MSMRMRTLTSVAAIGIAAAMTTIPPTQASVIGPAKLPITEPASLAVPAFLGGLFKRVGRSTRKVARSPLPRQRRSIR